MWGSIKIGYKITFGAADGGARRNESVNALAKAQSALESQKEELAKLTSHLQRLDALKAQMERSISTGHGLFSKFQSWIHSHDGNDDSYRCIRTPPPGISNDEAALLEKLWSSLTER